MLRDMVAACARNYPSKTAYFQGRRRSVTWKDIDRGAARLAVALAGLGVGRGDAAAILSQERLEVYEHWFACMKLGAVRVGINWRYSWVEIEHILRESGARVLLVDTTVSSLLKDHVPAIRDMGIAIIGFGADHGMDLDYDTLLGEADADAPLPDLLPSDVRLISYTSGTTGVPKGVVLTDEALENAIVHMALCANVRSDDVWYRPNQTSWIVLVANSLGLANGMTIAFPDGRFEVEAFLKDVQELRVTVGLLVPTSLKRVMEAYRNGDYDLSTLRVLFYGSSSTRVAIIKQAQELLGCDLFQVYGLTEVGGWVSYLTSTDHELGLTSRPELLESVGRVSPNFRASIRDDDGNELPAGEVGTLWLEGRSVMAGYLNLPELTQQVLVNGAVCTNDLGTIDEDGYLYLKDRRNFLIITGAVNVFPAGIESVLVRHPDVEDVAVVGVPHDDWGEAVVAVVTGRFPSLADLEKGLRDTCEESLSKMEIPKAFLLWDELPKTPNGKTNKNVIKQKIVDERLVPWLSA